MITGTMLTFLYVVFFLRGQKYNYLLEPLSGDDFPFPTLYSAGLALQELKIFAVPNNNLGRSLRENVKLVYPTKYSEYYTRIIWAQGLSLGLLLGAVSFLLAAILPDLEGLLALLGVVLLVLPGYYFINHVSEQVSTRRDACEASFPNAISKLALLVNSGTILHEAWVMVAYGNEGELYTMMQQSCDAMRNGKSDAAAISEFGFSTNSDDIKKFTSALVQSIERGGGELPSFLSNQSKELWAHRRQVMLQKGEKAASALLMPIALMFLGVMLIVICAAMQSFSM